MSKREYCASTLDLEVPIADAVGTAEMLDVIAETILQPVSDEHQLMLFGRINPLGHRIFALTREQHRALVFALGEVNYAARKLNTAYYGPEAT